jgi:hypothetical protein
LLLKTKGRENMKNTSKTGLAIALVAVLVMGSVSAQTVTVNTDTVKSQYISFAIGNGATRTATVANDKLYQVWYPMSICPSIGAASNIVTISYTPSGGAAARVLVSDYAVTAKESPVALSLIPPLKYGDALTIVSGAATNVAAAYNLVYAVGVDTGK